MNTRNLYIFTFLVLSSVLLSWQRLNYSSQSHIHKLNSSGSVAGRTGAPGESQTCASCHGGNLRSGMTENSLLLQENGVSVQTYTPGTTYDVVVSTATPASRKGFQTTVLNGSNGFTGTLNAVPSNGVTQVNGMGRTYVNQTSSGAVTSNFPEWRFEWTAPSTDQGPVTFYLATNVSNNNGTSNGDTIYLSQHTFGSPLGVEDLQPISAFNAWLNADNQSLNLKFHAMRIGEMHLNIVDLNGRTVLEWKGETAHLGENQIALKMPPYLKKGLYMIHLFVGNDAAVKKIRL